MENTQINGFVSTIEADNILLSNSSIDRLWKKYYLHSYTAEFFCENCAKSLDIDGWFYSFEPAVCPNCGFNYSGIFGRILKEPKVTYESRHKGHLILETFEGQEVDIPISPNDGLFMSKAGHMVLVIFSNALGRGKTPWCIFDWSADNNTPHYFDKKISSAAGKNMKHHKVRNSISNSVILFGLISLLGLCGLLVAISPAVRLF